MAEWRKATAMMVLAAMIVQSASASARISTTRIPVDRLRGGGFSVMENILRNHTDIYNPAAFQELKGKQVCVLVENGLELRGILNDFDESMNVVLQRPVQRWDGKTNTLVRTEDGNLVIRGSTVMHIGLV